MLGSVNGRSLPLIGYQDYCDATIWALATLNKLKVPSHPTSWVAVCVAAHCIRCEQTLSWSQQHDFHHYFVLFSTQHGTQTHTESIERVWAGLQLKVIRRSLKLSCSDKLSCRPTTQIQIALQFRGAIEKVPLLLKESRYLLPKSSFWRSLTDIIIRKFLHERKSSLRCVTYQPSCFFLAANSKCTELERKWESDRRQRKKVCRNRWEQFIIPVAVSMARELIATEAY